VKWGGGSSVNIDLGVVSKYFSDKGFGFVRGLLLGSSSEIFFHIKAIKKTDSQLAARLVSDHFSENFHFWFETEVTPKGTQVRTVLSPEQIRLVAITDQTRLIARVESYWRNWERQKPSWLDVVTSDLVGRDRTDELSLERGRLEAEEQKKLELERKEVETKAAIEQEDRHGSAMLIERENRSKRMNFRV
jgi:cold shock CspA family protein